MPVGIAGPCKIELKAQQSQHMLSFITDILTLSDLLLAARHQDPTDVIASVLPAVAAILLTWGLIHNRKKTPPQQPRHGRRTATGGLFTKWEDSPLSQPDYLATQIKEGIIYYQERNYTKAEEVFRRIVQNPLYATQTTMQHALAHRMLALACAQQGKVDDAFGYCSRAIELYDRMPPVTNSDSVQCRQDLAWLHSLRGDLCKAEATLREVLSRLERRPERPDSLLVLTLCRLAQVRQNQGQLEDAERLLHESLLCYDNGSWRSDKDHIAILERLAEVQLSRKQVDEGTATLQRVIEIQERFLGADHPAVAQSLLRLWQAYMEDLSYLKAERACRKALEIEEKRLGPDHPTVGVVITHVIVACERQGRFREAAELAGRQLAIFSGAPAGTERDHLAIRLCQYAAYLRSQDRTGDADAIESIVIEGSPDYATWLRPEQNWHSSRWN